MFFLCRVLPACKHAFHTACLDPWLHSKALCPVCRTAVEAPPVAPEAAAAEAAMPVTSDESPPLSVADP